MQLTARTSFKSAQRGSLKFEWTRPVWAAKPDGLRWYVQLFSGYGETMLDYNHRPEQHRPGLHAVPAVERGESVDRAAAIDLARAQQRRGQSAWCGESGLCCGSRQIASPRW